MWVALLASALHDEMCSLDDECALERYRWQKILTNARMYLVNLLQNPCTLNRSRGFDFLSGSEEINVQELLAMARTEA